MKTLRLHAVHDLRLTEDPMPVPGNGETLLKVASVGICGSDAHWYTEGRVGNVTLDKPLILGHEFTAVIADGPNQGQRVAVDPAIPCGKCEWCLEGKPNVCPNIDFAGTGGFDGSLREYMTWPTQNLFPLPENVSNLEGAMLEPFGVALHATHLAKIEPGMSVGIYGTGPIGLLVIQIAHIAGATRIFATDKIASRLEVAREMGATDTFLADGDEAKQILSTTNRRGVDLAFEAAGDNGAVNTAVVTAKPGGRVVIIGISTDDQTIIPASPARKKGLTVMMCRRMANIFPRAIRLVSSGQINLKPLMSFIYPFSEYDRAFKLAEQRAGIKVMIDFDTMEPVIK